MTKQNIQKDDLDTLLETLENEMKKHQEESEKLDATHTHLIHLKETHEALD